MSKQDEAVLNGAQRAAMLISALDEQKATALLEQMSEKSLQRLREAALSLEGVSIIQEEKLRTVTGFLRAQRESALFVGDVSSRFQRTFQKALGREPEVDSAEAKPATGEAQGDSEETGDKAERQESSETCQKVSDLVRGVPEHELAKVLSQESARCGAVLLSALPGESAGLLLNRLEPEKRESIAERMVGMGEVQQEIVMEIARGFQSRLHATESGTGTGSEEERMDELANMVSRLESESQKRVLISVQEADPDRAEQIERRIFAFEDLVNVEERCLQELLRDVEPSTIAVAIKGVPDQLEEVITGNLSERVAEQVEEERELAGRVPLSEAREARDEIRKKAREMDQAGSLYFRSGGQQEEFVE